MTGSYHNYFRIFDVDGTNDIVLQADKSAFKAKKIGGPGGPNKAAAGAQKNGLRPGGPGGPGGLKEQMTLDTVDFNKKILHGSWHPRENTIAVSIIALSEGSIANHSAELDRSDQQSLFIQCSMTNEERMDYCVGLQ